MRLHETRGKPVCAVLSASLAAHGVPDEILTDNGNVFTGRFKFPQPVDRCAPIPGCPTS